MQFLEDGFEGTWRVQNWVDYGSWMKHDGWFWWALYTHWKHFTWEPIQPSQDAEQRFQVNTYTHENPSWHLLGGEQNIFFYDLLTEMGLPEHLHWFLQKAPRTAALDAFSWFSGARFTSMYITAKFSNIPFLKFHSCGTWVVLVTVSKKTAYRVDIILPNQSVISVALHVSHGCTLKANSKGRSKSQMCGAFLLRLAWASRRRLWIVRHIYSILISNMFRSCSKLMACTNLVRFKDVQASSLKSWVPFSI